MEGNRPDTTRHPDALDRMIREWDGMAVIHSYDPPTESRIFIALHDARLGAPLGGTRMRSYPSSGEALRDAMRLAEGMTWKWAGIGLGYGGGKAVVDVPSPLAGEVRAGFFRRYGRLLESIHGAFSTGVDLGTDPEDMAVAATETRHVHGATADGQTVDPGPFTALGVLSGIRAGLEHRHGDGDPDGRTVLVQGVGDVGEPLARELSRLGARLLLADTDEERVRDLADELGARVVRVDEAFRTECDVYAPCAVGGVLNDETIPELRCHVVAGSANNQLEAPRHAGLLHDRGILYAPDYLVNAGGALAFGLMHRGIEDREELRRQVRGLGDRLREIFREADERDESPLHGARRLAERTLREGVDGSDP